MITKNINWKFINAKGLILGRLCSKVAKFALLGEKIVITNATDVQISGNKRQIIDRYIQYKNIKTHTNPKKGPFRVGTRPDIFIKKTIKGMLPMKKSRGKEAIKRVHVYLSSIPEKKIEQYGNLEKFEFSNKTYYSEQLGHKMISVGEVCKIIGWNQGKM